MKVLGINAYHADSSACLIIDGNLIAAAEEERFLRIKHWAGFPSEAIKYCLEEGDTDLSDIDYVAVNTDPKAQLIKKGIFVLKTQPSFQLIKERLSNAKQRQSIIEEINSLVPKKYFNGRFRNVEHHLAHLSSAYHVSPFSNSIIVSVDGFGDFASVAWGLGEDHEINVKGKVLFPHSLGIFYESITQYLGFPNYGDEYKVMGLAPYGQPTFIDEMRDIVLLQKNGTFKLNLDYFIFHKNQVEYKWENGSPTVGRIFSEKLEEVFGPARKKEDKLNQKHMDIAYSVQAMYEEAFFHLLNYLHSKYKIDNLCIAGGCGNNSVANGKVKRMTDFKNVYVQSASGDAGGAIGAAFITHHKFKKEAGTNFTMDHAYFGNSYTNDEIEKILDGYRKDLEDQGCEVIKINDQSKLYHQTVEEIIQGSVVGWFQGRMEWGPRALGNRSILCDPRRTDMKDILNKKIKRRESFRPFAPSILRDAVKDWFEEDDDVPYMMKVFQIREDKRQLIPAVAHADGSGRLQTVYEKTNKRYYDLIQAFAKQTNVPILLNTSFNENEPVVRKPEEAIDCFLRTRMDLLVMENWFIRRK